MDICGIFTEQNMGANMKHILALVALALPFGASAQDISQYTTEELVEFYVKSIDLGKARGICIGTAEECADPVPQEPKGLDMLVTFELDSADLTEAARQNLAVFASMMQDRRLKVASFVVEGHTDGRGGENYNNDLSRARAEAVTNYLVNLGVDTARLTAIGFGKGQPRVDDVMDPENRRVEMRIDLK